MVSIRSPRRSEGRYKSVGASPVYFVQFQSAPPAEARGDAGYCNQLNFKRLYRWLRDSNKWK